MQTTFTLPLLGLLPLLLASTLAAASSFAKSGDSQKNITVPTDGVYIVSVVSDPSGDATAKVYVQVNDEDTTFAATAHHNVIAGLSVALPLNAKDKVGVRVSGSVGSAVRLSVGFATASKGNFLTVRSKGDTTVSYGHRYALFNQFLTTKGHWNSFGGSGMYLLSLPVHGVHWVMARPSPPSSWSSFDIGGGLFKAYSGRGVPTSASGAFFLTTVNHKLDMRLSGTSSMLGDTLLSCVYLEGNTPAKLGSNPSRLAYTALVDNARTYGVDEKIHFNRKVELDVGDMYISDRRVFSVRVSGSYVVSLRGHPKSGGTLQLVLYRNTEIVFRSYSERGVSSGQSTVLDLVQNDELYVLARSDRSVGENTMMSIALLCKKT